jgi:hypothetical protein
MYAPPARNAVVYDGVISVLLPADKVVSRRIQLRPILQRQMSMRILDGIVKGKQSFCN